MQTQSIPGPLSTTLFRSFWMAGYESACHINRHGTRLDMICTTQHDIHVDEDYALLRTLGIQTVREGVRWPLIERHGHYDFASVAPMVEAANRHEIEPIWTLCHYGWPDDLDVFSDAFIERFARFCGATAAFIAHHSDAIPIYIPINEISFLAWAAGDLEIIYPFYKGRGNELKRQLVRAALAACDAIWEADPQARIAQIDPVIHIVPPRNQPEMADEIRRLRASQFAAWDMLSGRLHPELGGHPRYLDMIGVNFYSPNQWEHPGIHLWRPDDTLDERWMPFHQLLAEVYERYQRPLFVAETSHIGVGRGKWLRYVADEVVQARAHGLPIEGICLYPIIDRPDWENANHWHNSGLWDLHLGADGRLKRVINDAYASMFHQIIADYSGH